MAVLPCPHLVLSVLFILAIPVKTSLEMKSLFLKAEAMLTVPPPCPVPPLPPAIGGNHRTQSGDTMGSSNQPYNWDFPQWA